MVLAPPPLAFGEIVAYRVTTHKANGDVEMKRIDGNSVTTFQRKWEGVRGVIVKTPKSRKVGFNLHPSGSRYDRVREVREGLEKTRRAYVNSNGFSQKKTMRHIASIPAEEWWSEKAESGPTALRDPKDLTKWCFEKGFNVVNRK